MKRMAVPAAALGLVAATLAAAPGERPPRPADAVALAAADAARLPPSVQPLVRYLTCYNHPATQRFTALRVLAGHVNELSTATDIVLPAAVDAGNLVWR